MAEAYESSAISDPAVSKNPARPQHPRGGVTGAAEANNHCLDGR
jgi:hypothetical protein